MSKRAREDNEAEASAPNTELDIVRWALIEAVKNYEKKHEAQEAQIHTAFLLLKHEIQTEMNDFSETLVENKALKRSLREIGEEQTRVRDATFSTKQKRARVLQDLYELEMAQYLGDRERGALESANEFIEDLQHSIKSLPRRNEGDKEEKDEADRERNVVEAIEKTSDAVEEPQMKKRSIDQQTVDAANFQGNLSKLKLLAEQLDKIAALPKQLSEIERALQTLRPH